LCLGSKFDKRQFHDQVLQLGPVPLSLLEKVIDDWIAASTSSIASRPALYSFDILKALALGFIGRFCMMM